MPPQKQRAARFAALHRANQLFILPNIWNVGSACVFAKQGFPAIATSSAGVAYDPGLPNGEAVTFADLLELVAKITARVDIPLSVDFERGYSETPDAVQENARELLRAGAVGCNLEDGETGGSLSPIHLQTAKIAALRALKQETGVDFVINTRTCACWPDIAPSAEKEAIAIERGHAFVQAGADCVFIPGALDDAIRHSNTAALLDNPFTYAAANKYFSH